jgi:DNA helicase-2/ATP-dependent DNA helicase PcrA
VWDEFGSPVDWWRLDRYVRGLSSYKAANGLMDFTDLLERVAAGQGTLPTFTHGVVDEAQDLTPLQWRVARRALGQARALVAGDDDQAVYEWAGADVTQLRALAQAHPVTALPVSHRLPEAVARVAREVADRVSGRPARRWRASGTSGHVEWASRPDEVDLSAGTWLLLARTRYQLRELADLARAQGVNYSVRGQPAVELATVRAVQGYEAWRAGRHVAEPVARAVLRALGRSVPARLPETVGPELAGVTAASPLWHDALVNVPLAEREFYLTLLRRGEKLTERPRVEVDTIHGAKGREADHVLLLLDLTPRVARGFYVNPDAEHRILFVGLTRARQTLTLVTGRTPYRYEL